MSMNYLIISYKEVKMKIISRFIAICHCFFLIGAFADNARFYVQVLDSVTDQPIPNISVLGTFTSKFPRWEQATEYSDFSGITGINGRLHFSGTTNCGRAGFRTDRTASYYATQWICVPYEKKGFTPFSWWQPDNLVVTIKLQRVEHPIPLVVKNFFKSGSDSVSVDYFEKGEGQIKIDLVKGALLPPLGEGEFADVVFTRLKREDLGMGTTFRGSIVKPAYRDSMAVKFTGEDNGLVEMPSNKSDGIKIRTAPEKGYKSDYLVSRGRDKNVKYFRTSDPDRNFAFRIRTKKDKNGKIVSAYYGKIYGDIEIKKLLGQTVFVAAPAFLYYLNPTPLDRNLEWDMKNNLCPKPNLNNENQP